MPSLCSGYCDFTFYDGKHVNLVLSVM